MVATPIGVYASPLYAGDTQEQRDPVEYFEEGELDEEWFPPTQDEGAGWA